MPLLSAFLFSFAANIDSFLIGMSCGVRQVTISFSQSIAVSLITLFGTLAALLLGDRLFLFLPARYAARIGNLLMGLFGIYYIGKFFLTKDRSTPSASATISLRSDLLSADLSDSSAPDSPGFSRKSVILYGLSLSANNLGIGLGAGITAINPFLTAFLSFLISTLLLLFGNHAGHTVLFQKCNRYADLISGFLLLILSFCL